MSLASRSPDLARLALAVVQPGFVGETAPSWLLARLEQGLGGVALFGRNIVDPAQVARLTAQVHEANPAALVSYVAEQGSFAKVRPDMKIVFIRDVEDPDERLKATATILRNLVRIAERKAA